MAVVDDRTVPGGSDARRDVRLLMSHYARTAEPASLRQAKAICLQRIFPPRRDIGPARGVWLAEAANSSVLLLSGQLYGAPQNVHLDQALDWLNQVTRYSGDPVLVAAGFCSLGCALALKYRLSRLPEDLEGAQEAFLQACDFAADLGAEMRATVEVAARHNLSCCSAEAFMQSGQLEQLETGREWALKCTDGVQDSRYRAELFDYMFGTVPGPIYMLVSTLGALVEGRQVPAGDRSVMNALARSTVFSNLARIDGQLAIRSQDIHGLNLARDLLEQWRRVLDELRAQLPGSPHRLTTIIELAIAHRAAADLGVAVALTSAIIAFESANVDEFTWLPGWSYRVGAFADCLRFRYQIRGDEADLHRATVVLRVALGQLTHADDGLGRTRDPRRASLEFGIARCLANLYDARRYQADAVRAFAQYRDATQIALETSPEQAFDAAVEWGRWASGLLIWREAGEALGVAQKAAGMLLRRQLLRRNKEARLTEASGLGADAALAFARCQQGAIAAQALGMSNPVAEIAEMSRKAVQALEMSRAQLLTEALERNTAVAELLGADAGLRARYIAAVARLRLLENADPGVGERVWPSGQR